MPSLSCWRWIRISRTTRLSSGPSSCREDPRARRKLVSRPEVSLASGHFTLVLHSHLPWVLHHGRWPHGVDWLNEATAETYLPLWRALHSRGAGGRPLGVALGLSPVLCEQLAHPDFHREFMTYVDAKIAAAREDRAC